MSSSSSFTRYIVLFLTHIFDFFDLWHLLLILLHLHFHSNVLECFFFYIIQIMYTRRIKDRLLFLWFCYERKTIHFLCCFKFHWTWKRDYILIFVYDNVMEDKDCKITIMNGSDLKGCLQCLLLTIVNKSNIWRVLKLSLIWLNKKLSFVELYNQVSGINKKASNASSNTDSNTWNKIFHLTMINALSFSFIRITFIKLCHGLVYPSYQLIWFKLWKKL